MATVREKRELFSQAEIEYIENQRLCRIATVSPNGEPEVSPVGIQFDGKYLYVGSHSQDIFPNTRRYRNITSGNNRVSVLMDDLASTNPWKPRGIRIQGTAEVIEHGGIFGKGKLPDYTDHLSKLGNRGRSQGCKVARKHVLKEDSQKVTVEHALVDDWSYDDFIWWFWFFPIFEWGDDKEMRPDLTGAQAEFSDLSTS
jgi:pyridoxamine 5'-phosphate oxidase family protein